MSFTSWNWSVKLFFSSKQLIRDAVHKNDFLKQLAKEQIIEIVECMYEMRARAGQWVIQEGEPGDRLFVVAGELISFGSLVI